MKTKRLVIILSVLIGLTLLVVLLSAVFTVQSISVNWLTKPNVLTVESNEKIISSSKIKEKTSVFTLKKKEYTASIEKNNAYAKVEKIEVAFPNKVIIHVSEREPYFYLNIGNSEYAILDEDLKVLELTTDLNAYIRKFGISPIELNIDSTMIANLTIGSGDFLNVACTDTLVEFTSFISRINYNALRAKNTLKTVRLKNDNFYIYTQLGLDIYINDVDVDFTNKLLKGFSVYEQYKDTYFEGTIMCYDNNTYLTPNDMATM